MLGLGLGLGLDVAVWCSCLFVLGTIDPISSTLIVLIMLVAFFDEGVLVMTVV